MSHRQKVYPIQVRTCSRKLVGEHGSGFLGGKRQIAPSRPEINDKSYCCVGLDESLGCCGVSAGPVCWLPAPGGVAAAGAAAGGAASGAAEAGGVAAAGVAVAGEAGVSFDTS